MEVPMDIAPAVEALLAGEKRLLQLVATGGALATVLDALCRLVDDTVRGCHCSVLLVAGGVFRHGAAPNLPDSLRAAIEGRELGPPHASRAPNEARVAGRAARAVDDRYLRIMARRGALVA